MNNILLIISIFMPMLTGLAIYFIDPSKKQREIFCLGMVTINSVIVLALVFSGSVPSVLIGRLSSQMDLAFKIDGISKVFATLIACLWPLATLWSFEYMYHEKRENLFFAFYTATYGITLGICFADNLITMYLFYELLTLITVPLIMHSRNEFSKPAGIKYIAYSIAGATASFIGIMIVHAQTGVFTFCEGGVFCASDEIKPIVYMAFLLMFFGFGVKAAVFPFYDWLPSVGVAPTPVTALLHAVAVVKSGCYAIIKVTYYIFGVEILRGTWAQNLAICFAAFTIIFGSIWAYRETHFKRRLAMSTVSNLSYIILGAMLMTEGGLAGSCLHMLYHGAIKICLFFVAGACHVQAHADYVTDIKGFGYKMPVTFGAFTVCSIGLVGIPPFCGYFSKYQIASAAVGLGSGAAWFGVAALVISAIFTAGYLFTPVIRAFFPGKYFDMSQIENVKDPGLRMKLPFVILSLLCLALGLCNEVVLGFVMNCIGGLC